MKISGTIVDVVQQRMYSGTVHVANGVIEQIVEEPTDSNVYIMPGFVDAHVHIESSMLPPSEFARLAVVHGTVATVSDPHEIANVLGVEGVRYMLHDAERTPMKITFGAPSCVPATTFETAGATVTADDIRTLFADERITYLSEMMNYPGVLFNDPVVMEKIAVAKEYNRPVDGHAPGLRGDDARTYISAGISTDHECFTLEEALEKVDYGMKILIREGSAAKNFEALHSLITSHTDMVMLCSDDKHPDSLAIGHLNTVVQRAVAKGHDVLKVLQCACVNPVRHYNLKVGLLQQGDAADFIVTDSLETFTVLQTYINGKCVAERDTSLLPHHNTTAVNNFSCSPKMESEFAVKATGNTIRVIEVLDGQLVTNELLVPATIANGYIQTNTERDILKVAVVNRYQNAPVSVGFITNFGLQQGAIASSVAHDSHNIIAVGVTDAEICTAVNTLIELGGGVCVTANGEMESLALDIAGLMSTADGYHVAETYSRLDARARGLGSQLGSPFMSLSFMALLVIPSLKMSDLGLFSGATFTFTDVQLQQ
ncbi:MAG: adenine deaminase [Candidatus Kapaibacterium sp.]|nr:adenine deaminase [Bacteroidota bacterium]